MLWFRCLLSTSKDSGVDGSQFIQSAVRICKKTYPNFLLLRTDQKSTLLESSKSARPGGSTPAIKNFSWDRIPTDLTEEVAIELWDTQVFSGSVDRGVLLEISWNCWIVWDVFIPMIPTKRERFCRPLPSWCSVGLLREILWKNMKKGRWSQRSGNGRLFFPKLEIFRSFQTSFFFGIITPCWVRFRGRFQNFDEYSSQRLKPSPRSHSYCKSLHTPGGAEFWLTTITVCDTHILISIQIYIHTYIHITCILYMYLNRPLN